MYQNAYQVSSENAKERHNLNDQVVVGWINLPLCEMLISPAINKYPKNQVVTSKFQEPEL